MKKMKYIMVLFLVVLFPLNVNALSAIPKLTCNKALLKSGETANCTITVAVSSGSLTSFSGKIITSSNLELSSVKSSNIWQGSGEGGRYELYTDIPKNSNVDIGTFIIKAKNGYDSNGTVTLENINLGDEKFKEISKSNLTYTLKAMSTDATLKSLSILNENLSPVFDINTTKYTLKTTSSKIMIKAVANDSSAKIEGIGEKKVEYGTNNYTIKVVSEAGNSKSYIITVIRPEDRSDINTLKSLSLSDGKINFSSDKLSYDITVDSDVENIQIKSILADSKAKYSIGSADMVKKLNYGLNSIKIVVKAENESLKIYTLNITRLDDRSSNNELSQLVVNEKNVTLIKDKNDYEVNVSYDTEIIKIEYVLADINAKAKDKYPEKLDVGENIFEINVTSENERLRTYRIKVIRNEKSVILSSDSSLKSLTIVGYQINFNKDKKEYTIKTNDKTLKVIPEVNDVNAKYEIKGDDLLQEGRIIRIIVTAQDNSSSEYKIVVKRIADNNIIGYIVFGIIELVIILGFHFILNIIKRRN